MLTIITGSSGVGKTELIPLVRALLPSRFHPHDFDEMLTEEVALDEGKVDAWRRETTRLWCNRAVDEDMRGNETVVFGLMFPKEVASLTRGQPYRILLLDCSHKEIAQRLYGKRFSTDDKRRKLMQATGRSPDEYIVENESIMQQLRTETDEVGGSILDTTGEVPSATADKVVAWILQ